MKLHPGPPALDPDEPLSTATLAGMAIAACLTGLAVAAWCAWLRSGRTQPIALYTLSLLVLAAATTAPLVCLRTGLIRRVPFLGLAPVVLVSIPVSGLFLPSWLVVSAFGVCGLGGLTLAVRSIRLSVGSVIAALICAIGVSAYVVVHYNTSRDLPILAPELALIGELGRDGYFHAALTHRIIASGMASTGVDGTATVLYHTGAHYLVAGMATSSATVPLLAFPIVSQVLIMPLTLYALGYIAAVLTTRRARATSIPVILSVSGLFAFEMFGTNSFASPGTGPAMVLFFLAGPLLYRLIAAGAVTRSEAWTAAALVLPFAVVKASLAAMWILVLVYASIRRSRWPLVAQGIVILLLAAAVVALCLTLRYRFYTDFTEPFFYYFTRYQPLPLYVGPAVPPLILVVLALIRNRARSWGHLVAAIRERRLLDAEIGVALLAVSIVIAATGAFPGSIPYWFFLSATWFAWPGVVVAVTDLTSETVVRPESGRFHARVRSAGPAVLGTAVVVAICAISLLRARADSRPVFDPFYRQSASLLSDAGLPVPRRNATFDWEILRTGRVFPRPVEAAGVAGAGQRYVDDVRRLAAGATSGIAVFVPPDNEEFWSLVPDCEAKPLFIAATTGVPMLLGMPPKLMAECLERMNWYGHRRVFGDAHSRAISRGQLCAHAQTRGIDFVIVLGTERSEAVACSSPHVSGSGS